MMQQKGHEFAFVARDKEVLQTLMEHYNIPFVSRGKGGKSLPAKLLYILKADFAIYRLARKFKPDLFLSFASTYAAHASKLCGKPHIALDDTEHAKLELLMYPPFTDVIINPSAFWKKFSEKQVFVRTFFELNYLHPNYFKPDESIVKRYGLSKDQVYFVLRFVSWNASHDLGARGLSSQAKISLVERLGAYGRVLVSAEGELPAVLERYRLRIDPVHLHHVLSFSSLYVGEGATTASECVALGVPAVYINSLDAGTLKEQAEQYGLISIRSPETLDAVIEQYLADIAGARNKMSVFRSKLLQDKIDGTAFLAWFVENYPQSRERMSRQPDHQNQFK